MKIVIGEGSCGIAAGALKVHSALEKLLSGNEDIKTGSAGCIGMCFLEPIVDIYEGKNLLNRLVRVSEKDAENIAKAVKTGDFSEIGYLEILPEDEEFLNRQTRIALRNCGKIDPASIEDYRENGGYKALRKVLEKMSPEEVIEEIKISGLAGRGGAGFPTWFKWNAARKNGTNCKKHLICNADEGDPGAFMDRALIESDPHSLIEGMLIGAYAIGASDMTVYVRAEYPLAIKRLEKAIKQAKEEKYNKLNKILEGLIYVKKARMENRC